jgi:hypothetical protein
MMKAVFAVNKNAFVVAEKRRNQKSRALRCGDNHCACLEDHVHADVIASLIFASGREPLASPARG